MLNISIGHHIHNVHAFRYMYNLLVLVFVLCITCVAVVLVKGLKVKRPCSSSSRSSPAALNMCSRGVPGNILKET